MRPENDFQKGVLELAKLSGWRVAHFRTAQVGQRWVTPVGADGKGFPDLCLVRERLIFAELKSKTGKPSVDQIIWAQALTAAGQEVYLWKPKDWPEIEIVLKRPARIKPPTP